MIERCFEDIPEDKLCDDFQYSHSFSLWSRTALKWEDLLKSRRILIISEAGSGKTYECKEQCRLLRNCGEIAFFIELSSLASDGLIDLLDNEEEEMLKAWQSSQSDTATFFLDSIDELKLTRTSFEQALKKLKKIIGNNLNRARVVITSRPTPFDKAAFGSILPIPPEIEVKATEESFAEIITSNQIKKEDKSARDWRTVSLLPLSDTQIVEFAALQKVDDPNALWKTLRERDALEFARRPQDFIELCSDWNIHKQIRTHFEQIKSNINLKLHPRNDREEPAELSLEEALEGAERIALALQFTRLHTIRHNAESDNIIENSALETRAILPDWQPDKIKALLERPLFGFASYGRVRFHHRSVVEFLAAQRLAKLLGKGMAFTSLKRLLFAETKGKLIVKPSKRPIAAWLAQNDDRVFNLLRDNEPEVLLNEGDPESLSINQRRQVLREYCNKYKKGGYRGIHVPSIQSLRFASEELSDVINEIWEEGVENFEIRSQIISLIESGKIVKCSKLVEGLAWDRKANHNERIMAIRALIAIDHEEIPEICSGMARGESLWPETIIRSVVFDLFPKHFSSEQFCAVLKILQPDKNRFGDMFSLLADDIASAEFSLNDLEILRDGLLGLLLDELSVCDKYPKATGKRNHLCPILASICNLGLEKSSDKKWFYACAVVTELSRNNQVTADQVKYLKYKLSALNAKDNEIFFWETDSFLQSLNKEDDPWQRLCNITPPFDASLKLDCDRDLQWIHKALGNKNGKLNDRAMLLEAVIRILLNSKDRKNQLEDLRPFISDEPELVNTLNEWLKPKELDKVLEKKRKKEEEQRRKDAKVKCDWILFWRELNNNPEEAFSEKKSYNTVYDLWNVMKRDGEFGRDTGWSRRIIENHFDKNVADTLRNILMKIWRDDKPTLPSERDEAKRNTILIRWLLGLAGIYAEAEDQNWAKKINSDEAKLVSRYALVGIGGLPNWLDDVAKNHPNSVDEILGTELIWALNQKPKVDYYTLLPSTLLSSQNIAEIFIPKIISWLNLGGDICNFKCAANNLEKIERAIKVLLEHGQNSILNDLEAIAECRLNLNIPFDLKLLWLSVFMQLNPSKAVGELSDWLNIIKPSPTSKAIIIFARIFGDRHDNSLLENKKFTPNLLLKLLLLAYVHIRVENDISREGSYTPGARDDAQTARNNILDELLGAKGSEGWQAKMKMCEEPIFAHLKDRILAVAEESWVQEIDSEIFNAEQIRQIATNYEAPPITNEAMFQLLKDRLFDLKDLLLEDVSLREVWAVIKKEKLMRRALARELKNNANNLYTVDQEAVTADEKETDIRLRSTASNHEAVIEIKLAEKWSANNLINTLEDQLLKKYMASKNCKSGVLLLTYSEDKNFLCPKTRKMIDIKGLMELLELEIDRIKKDYPDNYNIMVFLLDLRPRLKKEN